jgi:asparagine synthetase B (glutamine-hydrolysing)
VNERRRLLKELAVAVNELGKALRALMRQSVARKLEGVERPVLFLSGGIDSTLLAVVLHDLQITPDVLTISYGEFENQDVRIARRTAQSLWPGVRHTVLHVARDFPTLAAHVRECIQFAGCSREAVVEVSLLMWAGIRRALEMGADGVLVGCEAGSMFGCDRAGLRARLDGVQAWRTARLTSLHLQECGWPLSATQVNRHFARSLGLRWLDPFTDHDLIRFHLPLNYKLLNWGRDKGLAHVAYPGLLKLRPVRYSMQSRAGVSKAAEILVMERGHKSPALFYNSIARELDINLHGDARWIERFERRQDSAFVEFIHSLIVELNESAITSYRADCIYPARGKEDAS